MKVFAVFDSSNIDEVGYDDKNMTCVVHLFTLKQVGCIFIMEYLSLHLICSIAHLQKVQQSGLY